MQAKWVTPAIVAVLLFSATTATAVGAPKPGASCKRAGSTQTVAGTRLQCVKRAGKLVWRKAPKAPATPAPTLDPASLHLQWAFTPGSLTDPAVLVDPDPQQLQDRGLNTSAAVIVTSAGVPRAGVRVEWSTTDTSSRLETLTDTSDATGTARIWLIAGAADSMTLTASVPGGPSVDVQLVRMTPPHRTLTRPVIAGFFPPAASDITSVEIEATLQSAPTSTYYALGSFANFYTGFQSINCAFSWDMYSKVCAGSRGVYMGREAHFSVWDGKSRTGQTLHPQLVSADEAAMCRAFDHEGSGMMCLVAFDWDPGDRVRLDIEELPGAPADYERLRVTARVMPSGRSVPLAVIDVPGGVQLGAEFIAFNENWELNASANCLAAPERRFTLNRIRYVTARGERLRPSSGYALGNVVAEQQALCLNYQISASADGLAITSGGTSAWPSLAAALITRSGTLTFSDDFQAKVLRRQLTATELAAIG